MDAWYWLEPLEMLMSPYDRWPELRDVRQPATLWRLMVLREPQLARFAEPCRSLGMPALVARLETIKRHVADRGSDERGGFSFGDAERLEAAAADALAIMRDIVATRTSPSREPEFAVDRVALCAACWRLVPIATRQGFRSLVSTAVLCTQHSPAAGRSNATALAAGKRRMPRIKMSPPRADGSLQTMANIFAADSPWIWSAFIDRSFRLVSIAHPRARSSVLSAFHELDELDRRPERTLLHEELARSADWGVGLLHAMLTTREFWLKVESADFHGGRR